MAHVWTSTAFVNWAATLLSGDTFALLGREAQRVEDGRRGTDAQEHVLLQRLNGPSETWVLMTDERTDLHLNGSPVVLGIAVLNDQDEILISGQSPHFFSTERTAKIEPYPNSGARGLCPRCKQLIGAGIPAVRCPACDLWHHASDELPCWTYAPQCAACPQNTAFDAGFRWTPEDL